MKWAITGAEYDAIISTDTYTITQADTDSLFRCARIHANYFVDA